MNYLHRVEALTLKLTDRDLEIKELPEGLRVGWNLELYKTKITKLPDDLKVKRSIYGSRY